MHKFRERSGPVSCDTFGVLVSLIALMFLWHARTYSARRTFATPDSDGEKRHYLREHSRRISTTVFTRALTYCRRERSHKGEITRTTLVKISYGGVPRCVCHVWIWILLCMCNPMGGPPPGWYRGTVHPPTSDCAASTAYTCFEYYISHAVGRITLIFPP